jgi:hypothetical protein
MWLFTVHGFYSVDAAADDGGPAKVMVRARCKGHLDNLRKRWPHLPAPVATPDGDYSHRIIIPLVVWEHLALALAVDPENYRNFKTAATVAGHPFKYTNLLHRVWDMVHGTYANPKRAAYSEPFDPWFAPAKPKKKTAKRKRARRIK